MTDIIIAAVVLVLIALGIRSGGKHFKGEGGCCGGGSEVKAKKKHLKKVVAKRTMLIEGMHCEHCKNRVERSLNAIDGVAASVNLKKNRAVISMEQVVSDELLLAAVEKAGYHGKFV